jgi:glycosyltransferase involved in cell wall biosynthesis
MAQQVYCLTHMLARFVTDFGNVVIRLDRLGYSVTVLSGTPSTEQRGAFDSAEQFTKYKNALPATVNVDTLPYRRGSLTLLAVARLFRRGLQLARKSDNAIFIVWTYVMIVTFGIPIRLLDRRCLFMVTGLGPILDPRSKKFRWLRWALMRIYGYVLSGKNSRCLVHNHEDKAHLSNALRIREERIFVTPGCGVDPRLFPFFEHAPQRDEVIILVPARLLIEKGIFDAALASGLLAARGIKHRMNFTGSVEPHTSIGITGEQIARLQSENACIQFVGFQDSLVPLYEECDIVCLPTRYPEGLPTALIEATACGRAVVTCDNVGCREIIQDGETGLLVPMGDAEALANALEKLIADRTLRDRLRFAAHRQFRELYTKDIALSITLASLESLGCTFPSDVNV